jgi:hypothetical protein
MDWIRLDQIAALVIVAWAPVAVATVIRRQARADRRRALNADAPRLRLSGPLPCRLERSPYRDGGDFTSCRSGTPTIMPPVRVAAVAIRCRRARSRPSTPGSTPTRPAATSTRLHAILDAWEARWRERLANNPPDEFTRGRSVHLWGDHDLREIARLRSLFP